MSGSRPRGRRDQLRRYRDLGQRIHAVEVAGGALMPAVALPGAERATEVLVPLRHRAQHRDARLDHRSAWPVHQRRRGGIRQGEAVGCAIVRQVAARSLCPQPLADQDRCDGYAGCHLGGGHRAGAVERRPDSTSGAQGGQQHAEGGTELGDQVPQHRFDRCFLVQGVHATGSSVSKGRSIPSSPQGREIRPRGSRAVGSRRTGIRS